MQNNPCTKLSEAGMSTIILDRTRKTKVTKMNHPAIPGTRPKATQNAHQ
jgi:hypothetical protein